MLAFFGMANVANISGRARAVAANVDRTAEVIHTVANELCEVRRAAGDLASTDFAAELEAAGADLRAAEASLQEAGERIDRVAKEVLRQAVSGNVGAVGSKSIPGAPISLTQVTNLLQVDRYPTHKKALEEWRRGEKALSSRVYRREIRSGDVTNHIFNIIGWYAVFQGVVLTAVSQLTQTSKDNPVPVCGKIWFPIVLTGFGTVVTIGAIIFKFTTLKSLEVTIQSEKQITAELQRRVLTLQQKGPQNFSFVRDTDDNLKLQPIKSFWKNKILVILSLLVFSAIFIFSYFVILCDTWTVRDWDRGIH